MSSIINIDINVLDAIAINDVNLMELKNLSTIYKDNKGIFESGYYYQIKYKIL